MRRYRRVSYRTPRCMIRKCLWHLQCRVVNYLSHLGFHTTGGNYLLRIDRKTGTSAKKASDSKFPRTKTSSSATNSTSTFSGLKTKASKTALIFPIRTLLPPKSPKASRQLLLFLFLLGFEFGLVFAQKLLHHHAACRADGLGLIIWCSCHGG